MPPEFCQTSVQLVAFRSQFAAHMNLEFRGAAPVSGRARLVEVGPRSRRRSGKAGRSNARRPAVSIGVLVAGAPGRRAPAGSIASRAEKKPRAFDKARGFGIISRASLSRALCRAGAGQ